MKKNQRHVLRLYLKNRDLAWELPGPIALGNKRIYEDTEIPERWPIVEMPPITDPWHFIGAMF